MKLEIYRQIQEVRRLSKANYLALQELADSWDDTMKIIILAYAADPDLAAEIHERILGYDENNLELSRSIGCK